LRFVGNPSKTEKDKKPEAREDEGGIRGVKEKRKEKILSREFGGSTRGLKHLRGEGNEKKTKWINFSLNLEAPKKKPSGDFDPKRSSKNQGAKKEKRQIKEEVPKCVKKKKYSIVKNVSRLGTGVQKEGEANPGRRERKTWKGGV